MPLPDLISLLCEYSCAGSAPSLIKWSTDYDVVLVYDANGKLAGVFCDDCSFVNSIRHLCANPLLIPNIFTPTIRCVIIQYKNYLYNISFSELMQRYSNRI